MAGKYLFCNFALLKTSPYSLHYINSERIRLILTLIILTIIIITAHLHHHIHFQRHHQAVTMMLWLPARHT